MPQRTGEETLLAGGEIIPARDGGAVRQQAVDQGGTDEAGGAGDEDFLHEKLAEELAEGGEASILMLFVRVIR